LLLLRLSKQQDLDLHELDFINNAPSIDLIKQLIAGKLRIFISDLIDSRSGTVNEKSKHLKDLARREQFILEERGAKDLYIGWPFVRGKFTDGTSVRAPLLFFPVSLTEAGNKWYLVRRDEISFNKSFLLAYAHFNGVSISDDFIDTSFEEWDKDFRVFKTELYKFLKDNNFEINFNQELFLEQLRFFSSFKKDDFEREYKNGELTLFPEAVLGIFPQAGSYLVPDYEAMLETASIEDLEGFFERKTNLEDKEGDGFRFIGKSKEENSFTPFKLDASQENALKAVKKGNSIVVQGPPGTGKSQLICNLVADYTARGKKVLVVCQKRAALDVVYNRLKEKGLDNFLGLVHDFKNDRQGIYKQLAGQIEHLEEYRHQNATLDAVYLERTFVDAARKIDQLTEELEEFKKALFDTKDCGISAKELYLTSSPELPFIDLHQEFRFFDAQAIHRFPAKLKRWISYAYKFEEQRYVWNDRVSFSNFGILEFKKIDKLLDEIPYYQSEISDKLKETLGETFDLEEGAWLANREEKIHHLLSLLNNPVIYKNFQFLLKRQTDVDEFTIRETKVRGCFKNEEPEASILSDQLGVSQQALQQAYKARSGPFKWLLWKLFSKDKFLVKRIFVANKLEWTSEGFKTVLRRLDNRMNLEHNITRLKAMGWLQNIPETKKLKDFEEWFHTQHTALAAKEILQELRSLKAFLQMETLSYPALREALFSMLEIIRKIPTNKRAWQEFLTVRQISKILSDYDYALHLKEVLKKDFEHLVEFDRLNDSLEAHEKEVLKKIAAGDKEKTPESAEDLFNNSIRLNWLNYLEEKEPVLRAVATEKLDTWEGTLQNAVEEKLRVSKEIVILRNQERAYKYVNYNRLNNMVTYRDLKHQVTKKKKIWPLRKLISDFYQEIFELIPCWLASPEAVSAIFPMETLFDLVIFDEASQCFSEKGIPAMYRGYQIVITGDDKQLNPSDLYQARWEEEEEEIPELEIDSLLDLGKKFLMQVQLRGHYRSASLDLIEFSNQKFYSGNLKMLPDFKEVLKDEPGIEYQKTEGVWENQTNLVEAEQVAKLVLKLSQEEKSDSIGVVTFNFKQQLLIQDKIEALFTKNAVSLPTGLIIKNIENIQGDERDFILFSIAYAPDKNGKMTMQFGSLNALGGENRLNVAITRARKKIYLITSIFPNQLKTDNTKHSGPKLLKAYLEYGFQISKKESKGIEENSKEGIKWLLKNRLKQLQLDKTTFAFTESFPYADLAVSEKLKYKGLIFTDDNLYLNAVSVKEAHAYMPLTLKDKHWKFMRVYSRQLWEKEEVVKEKITKTFSDE